MTKATRNYYLEIRNHKQLVYLVRKFPEPFALRQAIIEYFGYKSGIDYQEIAEATLDES